MSNPTRARVVYVAGYGRSGSTILDMLLAGRPGVFGAGELTYVFADRLSGTPCSCGEPLSECNFWAAAFDRWRRRTTVETARAAEITRRCDRSMLLPGRPVSSGARETYRLIWSAMLAAIAEESGAGVIVDSSKTMGDAANRPRRLAASLDRPLTVVHLVRNPGAVLHSVGRGRGPLSSRPRRTPSLATLKTAFTWPLANRAAARSRTPDSPPFVRYEDLITAPDATVSRILGNDADDEQASGDRDPVLESGHAIRGNRVRSSGPIELRLDDEWERAPRSAPQRISGAILAPFGRRYGY